MLCKDIVTSTVPNDFMYTLQVKSQFQL